MIRLSCRRRRLRITLRSAFFKIAEVKQAEFMQMVRNDGKENERHQDDATRCVQEADRND